jgi:hypothetical protein
MAHGNLLRGRRENKKEIACRLIHGIGLEIRLGFTVLSYCHTIYMIHY